MEGPPNNKVKSRLVGSPNFSVKTPLHAQSIRPTAAL